ncbi:MAG TPA: DUF3053 family protein [Bosea sp. (in: a-proteobacteria)]|jgi:hypothetical protein|uniref:DUF3053 family protein n=1 Tax=Bosea sp. (in: a-proteobacteria) TaxID=1871050 RepID=UPI002E103B7C|nr:DUF3053 family protein [Bosea sp. (in: a-proteobacteria)]
MAGRLVKMIASLMAGLLLVACSPSESDQRKAFIAFLQSDVLPRQGARVPQPNAEKQKSFGDYAAHYAVITRFHERMNASVANPMQETMAKGLPRTIEEVVKRKSDIAAVRAGFAKMKEALDQSAAAADTERAALKQPDDLKTVYAATWDKLVAQPVATFREIFPPTDEAFGSALAMADLIDANRPAIKLSGSQIEISNAALRTKVQAAMTAMASKQRAMFEAQQKLRRMVYGS